MAESVWRVWIPEILIPYSMGNNAGARFDIEAVIHFLVIGIKPSWGFLPVLRETLIFEMVSFLSDVTGVFTMVE